LSVNGDTGARASGAVGASHAPSDVRYVRALDHEELRLLRSRAREAVRAAREIRAESKAIRSASAGWRAIQPVRRLDDAAPS
jgi:hypothetical protein